MALTFGAATTDRVDCGSGSTVDDLQGLTAFVVLYPTALTAGVVPISKYRGATGQGWEIELLGTAGNWLLTRPRATTAQSYQANDTPIKVREWNILAAASDAAEGHLYTGRLNTPLTESTYGTATVGVGSFNSDADRQLMVGNRDAATPNGAFTGIIAYAAVFNRLMTLGECRQFVDRYLSQSNTPMLWPGQLLNMRLGRVSTTQQYDRSNYGNNGTGTGVVMAVEPPVVMKARRRSVPDKAAAVAGRVWVLAGYGGGLVGPSRGLAG